MKLKTHFIHSGNTIRLTDDPTLKVVDNIPCGTYSVKYNADMGFYFLQQIEDLTIPSKTYGKVTMFTDRFVNTFNSRTASTGILLCGEKGSGKTMQAKHVSQALKAQNVPTLIVNDMFFDEGFKEFIQSIEQDCMVFFDEYEKVYHDPKAQEQLLTLLDGTIQTKKLFVFTINNHARFNEHMINRPGRIFYRISYEGVSADTIREYCEEKLNNKNHIEEMVSIGSVFREFNFDMMKAIVEESNRYNESPSEAINILNIVADSAFSGYDTYTVVVVKKTDPTKILFQDNNEYITITRPFNVSINKSESKQISISMANMVNADNKNSAYTFEKDGFMVSVKKNIYKELNVRDMLAFNTGSITTIEAEE